MMAIKVDLEELHPDESDFLISADSVLSELHAAFIDTRSRATELKKERYALGLLKEFRAGIIIHNQHDQPPDMRWHELIHRLVGDIES
jgi:hypothetical protein